MIRLLALFLCALPLFAEGGIQASPAWPNQYGSELLVDGDLESLTNWSVDSCAAASAGQGVGGSAAVAITGNCNGIEQNFTMPDAEVYPWIAVEVWARKAAATDYELTISLRDQTHGGGLAPANSSWESRFQQSGLGRLTEGVVVSGGDYIRIYRLFSTARLHGGDSWRVELNSAGGTGGTLYLDNASVKGVTVPLNCFVKYPVYSGYHWSGFDTRHAAGTGEEAAGFCEVRPPSGTIADTYFEVHLDTTAGCASPVLTTTVQPTVQRTGWEIDISAMSDDETWFLCFDLRLDSDDSLIADYPDWKIVQRTEAWRTANVKHWVDDYGTWVKGTERKFMFQTYLRTVGHHNNPCSVCTDPADYLAMYGIKAGTSLWGGITSSGRNSALWFSPFSGANPDNGGVLDQVGPYGEAMTTAGLSWWYTSNLHYGTQFGLDEDVAANLAPTPSVSCASSGGSIDDAWVYVKVSGVGGRNTLAADRFTIESEGSLSDHDGALSGSANSCEVVIPPCTGVEAAYWVYAAGAASESEPANSAYSLQDTAPLTCGSTFTLDSISTGNKAPNTTSVGSDYGNIPSFTTRTGWIPASETFENAFDELETSLAADGSLIGQYLGDEVTPFDIGWTYRMSDYLRVNHPGRLNIAVTLQTAAYPGVDYFFTPVMDVNGQDVYYQSEIPNETAFDDQAQNGTSRSLTCYSFAGLNATDTFGGGGLNKVDEWVDEKMRSHEGARLNLVVGQQWGRNSVDCFGWTLDELRKQAWKSIIAMQNWGSIGGYGTWGWVSAAGLDRMARLPDGVLDNSPSGESIGNTKAYEDDIQAGSEMMTLEQELLEPVDDSTQLGFGTVLDLAPESSLTLPTATCAVQDADGNYIDPIRTVAKEMPNGDQWIFATNLCPDSQTMTFSLANATGKIATDYFTGATYTITDGDFDVDSTDFGVHVIKVETPKGGGIRGR